jgi:hypothetical protein
MAHQSDIPRDELARLADDYWRSILGKPRVEDRRIRDMRGWPEIRAKWAWEMPAQHPDWENILYEAWLRWWLAWGERICSTSAKGSTEVRVMETLTVDPAPVVRWLTETRQHENLPHLGLWLGLLEVVAYGGPRPLLLNERLHTIWRRIAPETPTKGALWWEGVIDAMLTEERQALLRVMLGPDASIRDVQEGLQTLDRFKQEKG